MPTENAEVDDRIDAGANSDSRASVTIEQPAEIHILRNVVDSLDLIIDPDKNSEDGPSQQELEQAETELYALYTRVSTMRKRIGLPQLVLGPENEPPSYMSVVSGTQNRHGTNDSAPFQTTLEWIDIVKRGSDNWSNLTLRLSRKVDEWDVIDFLLVNGKKINKPVDGWGEECGPHVIYGTKKPTSFVSDLAAVGLREIHYAVAVDRSEWGTKTIARSFKIKRWQRD